MIGISNRLSTLVIDVNKSWEGRQLTNVVLTPSLIYTSDFQNAKLVNCPIPWNDDFIIESTTTVTHTGETPTVKKSLFSPRTALYSIRFDAQLLSSSYAGYLDIYLGGTGPITSTLITSTSLLQYNTPLFSVMYGQTINCVLRGLDSLSQITLITTRLYGSNTHTAPSITLE